VVECLPSKHEALSSKESTPVPKDGKKKRSQYVLSTDSALRISNLQLIESMDVEPTAEQGQSIVYFSSLSFCFSEVVRLELRAIYLLGRCSYCHATALVL
jgi:hypothetical protein